MDAGAGQRYATDAWLGLLPRTDVPDRQAMVW